MNEALIRQILAMLHECFGDPRPVQPVMYKRKTVATVYYF